MNTVLGSKHFAFQTVLAFTRSSLFSDDIPLVPGVH